MKFMFLIVAVFGVLNVHSPVLSSQDSTSVIIGNTPVFQNTEPGLSLAELFSTTSLLDFDSTKIALFGASLDSFPVFFPVSDSTFIGEDQTKKTSLPNSNLKLEKSKRN